MSANVVQIWRGWSGAERAAALALGLAGVGLIAWGVLLWREWGRNPDLSHGFLALPAVWLLWRRAREDGPGAGTGDGALTLGVLAAVAGMLGAGLLTTVYAAALGWQAAPTLFCASATAVSAAALALWLATGRAVRWISPGWPLMVLLAVVLLSGPLPPGTYARLTASLQELITIGVVDTLRLFGIPALRAGNIIHLGATSVGVEEACSGVRSLVSCVMAGLVLSALLLKSPVRRAWLVGLAAPLALITNFARSLTLTMLARHGVDISGAWHDGLGYAVLGVTTGLLAWLAFALEGAEQGTRKGTTDYGRQTLEGTTGRRDDGRRTVGTEGDDGTTGRRTTGRQTEEEDNETTGPRDDGTTDYGQEGRTQTAEPRTAGLQTEEEDNETTGPGDEGTRDYGQEGRTRTAGPRTAGLQTENNGTTGRREDRTTDLEPRTMERGAGIGGSRTVGGGWAWVASMLGVGCLVMATGWFGFIVLHAPSQPVASARPDLERIVPAVAPAGWQVATRSDLGRFAGVLRTEHLLERTYSKTDEAGRRVTVTVYVAWWPAGATSVSAVATHTPEACWPGTGWAMDETASVRRELPLPGGRAAEQAEQRAFRNGDYPQTVWFWHLVDGHPLAPFDPRSWQEQLSLFFRQGARGEAAQAFVRISSNLSWEELADEPLLSEVLAGFAELGVPVGVGR